MILSLLLFPILSVAASFLPGHLTKNDKTLLLFSFSALWIYFSAIFSVYQAGQILLVVIVSAFLLRGILLRTKFQFGASEIGIVIVIFFFNYLAAHFSLELHDWDEFSHWATVQKVIKTTRSLSIDTSFDLGASYIQGYSLLVDSLSSSSIKNESSLYAASGSILLTFAFLSFNALASTFSKTQPIFNMVMLFAFILIPIKIDQSAYSLFTIYVDFPLAVFLTGALLSTLVVKSRESSFILLLSSCIFLTLTKHIGFLFSLLALIIWAFAAFRVIETKKIIQYCFFVVLAIIVVKYSWDWHLQHLQIKKYFNEASITVAKLLHLLKNSSDDVVFQTMITKITENLSQNWLLKFSFLTVLLATVLGRFFRKTANLRPIIGYLFFNSFYLLILILSYRFLFGEYEAVRIASFDRYLASGLLPWALYGTVLILQELRGLIEIAGSNRRILYSISIFFLVLSLWKLKTHAQLASHTFPTRIQIKATVEKYSTYLSEKTKIFFIRQDSNGLECLMSRYEFFPSKISCDNWSVGKPFGPDDVWTHNLSVDELRDILFSFDYVWVNKDGGELWSKYGTFFDKKEAGFFKVTRGNDPILKSLD